jgi:hypothetical protein
MDIDRNNAIQAELLALLQTSGYSAIRDLATVRFNKEDRVQLFVICTYSSILELTFGCMALIEKKVTTALPLLIRTVVEAYVDLRAIRNDPKYLRNVMSGYLKERLRLIDVDNLREHPFLAGLTEEGDLAGRKGQLEEELKGHRDAGYPPLPMHAKFDRAGMKPVYQSLYWYLCLDSHNDLSTLEERHLEGDEVVLFKGETNFAYTQELDALLTTLIDSSVLVHEVFKSVCADTYRQHAQTLARIREGYAAVVGN